MTTIATAAISLTSASRFQSSPVFRKDQPDGAMKDDAFAHAHPTAIPTEANPEFETA